ncbi:MAG: hypothetical protein Q7T96_19855 [Methylobacter sp.]|nr:hypothetical protein [Methylobacter sp.]
MNISVSGLQQTWLSSISSKISGYTSSFQSLYFPVITACRIGWEKIARQRYNVLFENPSCCKAKSSANENT